jgi:hypothetical protein
MSHSNPASQEIVPPRLLLGATVMVWGALTSHGIIAVAAALLIEARHWVNWRWRFGYTGYSRAWMLSLFALAGTVGYHSLNNLGPAALLNFLEWLPLIFLPLILAQQYGESFAIPGTVFSVLARRRQKRDQKLGRHSTEHQLHFGYPYFALSLLSAGYTATGEREQWTYFAILIILTGTGIYYVHGHQQRRVLPWIAVLLLTGGLSMASSKGLLNLYEWLKNRNYLEIQGPEQFEEQITAIGRLGELKLDRRLQWRVQMPPGELPPRLLMTKGYNFYRQGKWQARDSEFLDYNRSFTDLPSAAEDKDVGEFAFEAEGFSIDDQATPEAVPLRIRGAVDSNRKAFPAPSASVLFTEATEVDAIEHSELGTLLAVNSDAVIDLEIWQGQDASLREPAPRQRIRNDRLESVTELLLSDSSTTDNDEREVFRELAAELQLAEKSDREKVAAIESYFLENFQYSTHLSSGSVPFRSPVVTFLNETKEGHCEYFATAASLLLRAADVPTRYVVGYAVHEKSETEGEYLLRGTHAHAWCRAYLGGTRTIEEEERVIIRNGQEETITFDRKVWKGGQWVNVDVTPPVWFGLDSPTPSWRESLADNLQEWREDFQLWRADESNRGWVNLVLVLVAVAVLAFVIWRLSGTRLREAKARNHFDPAKGRSTPLLEALPHLEKRLGRRPPGRSLSHWLPEQLNGSDSFSHSDLGRMLSLHEKGRFAQRSFTGPENRELESLVTAFLRSCSQRK